MLPCCKLWDVIYLLCRRPHKGQLNIANSFTYGPFRPNQKTPPFNLHPFSCTLPLNHCTVALQKPCLGNWAVQFLDSPLKKIKPTFYKASSWGVVYFSDLTKKVLWKVWKLLLKWRAEGPLAVHSLTILKAGMDYTTFVQIFCLDLQSAWVKTSCWQSEPICRIWQVGVAICHRKSRSVQWAKTLNF